MSVVDISNIFADAGSSRGPGERWYLCRKTHDQIHKDHYACMSLRRDIEAPDGDNILVSIAAGCPQVFDQLTLSYKLRSAVKMERQGQRQTNN